MAQLAQSKKDFPASREADKEKKDQGEGLPNRQSSKGLSENEIKDLIQKARQDQEKFEKSLGRSLAPLDPAFKATTLSVTNDAGQEGILVRDRHFDMKVFAALQNGLNRLVGVDPSKIVFIAEGSGKGIKGPEFSPNALLENLANKHAIPVENAVRNLSDWVVVDGIIKANVNSSPPLDRQAIVGLITLDLAKNKRDITHENIPNAIEDVRKTWLAGDKSLSVEALYNIADKALDIKADVIKKFSKLAIDVAKASGAKEVDARDWKLVSEIIKAGEELSPPINKEQSLGCLILLTSPSSREGNLFPLQAMNQVSNGWGKQVTFEELHESIIAAGQFSTKNPVLHFGRQEQLKKSIGEVQDTMTTAATQAIIQKYPNASQFLVISGYSHTQSISKAFGEQK